MHMGLNKTYPAFNKLFLVTKDPLCFYLCFQILSEYTILGVKNHIAMSTCISLIGFEWKAFWEKNTNEESIAPHVKVIHTNIHLASTIKKISTQTA